MCVCVCVCDRINKIYYIVTECWNNKAVIFMAMKY